MSRIALALAAATDRHLVVLGDLVLEVERVNSDQLRRHGWSELEGSSSAREALALVRQEKMAAREAASGNAPEVSAARLEHHRTTVAAQSQKAFAALTARPEGQVAFVSRCTAYVCAMVVRAGFAKEGDLPGVKVTKAVGRLGVLPAGTDPATVTFFKEGEQPLETMRYVQDRSKENPAEGVLWVHRLTEEQRTALGLVLIGLQSVAPEVTPFRVATGGAPADPPAREGVREVAARGAQADAVPDGAGGGVRGAARRDRRKSR